MDHRFDDCVAPSSNGAGSSTPVWRWLDSGAAPGSFNMALDEAMLTLHQRGRTPPTVRVYAWNPPCVSLGYFQPVEEIDTAACNRRGYDLVRRPTGGRAILHADELTYSIIVSEEGLNATGVLPTYRRLMEGVISGLERLGIEAQLKSRPIRAPEGLEGSCFASTARCDLAVGDDKIAGSAQLRRKGHILQHGSLPFSFNEAAANELFARNGHSTTAGARHRVTDLRQAAGSDKIAFRQLAGALKAGFEESLGVSFVQACVTREELELADTLQAEKYGNPEWINRR